MSQFLINLTLALVTADLLHNLAEATNVRGKVARLSAYINKQPYTEMKVKYNSNNHQAPFTGIGGNNVRRGSFTGSSHTRSRGH